MIRSTFVTLFVVLVGLFGYYFFRSSAVSNEQKAREAVAGVGDTVRDQGVASLVQMRLVASLGYDAVRFIHVHFDEGRAVIYGLLPESIQKETLIAHAKAIPGVNEVDVQVLPRPGTLAAAAGAPASAAPPKSP